MHIRRLVSSDAGAYQVLRLQALRDSPTAFGSSYEEECDTPIDMVAAFLAGGSDRNMFGAFVEEQLVGMIGVGREGGRKEAHKGFIRSMYVVPARRGEGIGSFLLSEDLKDPGSFPARQHSPLAV